jgi:transposase-like protein
MGKNQTTRVRRAFTPQFKRDAVKLVNEGKTSSEVARDLGIQFIATKRPVGVGA